MTEEAHEAAQRRETGPLPDRELRMFIEKQGDNYYRTVLQSCKKHPRKPNQKITAILAEYDQDIPSFSEVAADYGPGDYRLQVEYEDGNKKLAELEVTGTSTEGEEKLISEATVICV